MEIVLDTNTVAVAITVIGAISTLIGVYWRARVLLHSIKTSIDTLVSVEQNQAEALTAINSTQAKCVETLDRMERGMITHHQENIQSHSRLLESDRAKKGVS